ncbi:MAG TPA: hypothetical protein VHL58_10260 [Thermoanaerobaculia bacterium]|nr:hypothetical protein [Thermoanaerobaculia bacterium]
MSRSSLITSRFERDLRGHDDLNEQLLAMVHGYFRILSTVASSNGRL